MKTYTISSKDDRFIEERIEGQTKTKKWFVQLEGEDLAVSDNYHTMDELYDHRRALNAFLFKMMCRLDEDHRGYEAVVNNPLICKSKLHNDGTSFEGYFVVAANTSVGQISYHYDLQYWNEFDIPVVEKIPWEYDGHTSQDVIERLLKL